MLKIERAEKHICDLECAFRKFLRTYSDTCTLHTYTDPETGALEVEVSLKAIPAEFSLILGDTVHNLRSALDHAMWELLGIDGGIRDDKTAFPISRGIKADYEAACRGIKTTRDDTKMFLMSLAAYPEGIGKNLLGLHLLDIIDKHTVLTPVIGVARIPHLEVIDQNGETFMTLTDNAFSMTPNGRARLISIASPVFTIKLDQDAKPSLDIYFGDVQFFEALPLIDTLTDLRIEISNVVDRFRELVEGRTWC